MKKFMFLTRVSIIFSLLMLGHFSLKSQSYSLSISSIDGKAFSQRPFRVNKPINIRGTVSFPKTATSTCWIQIAVKRKGDRGWQIFNSYETRSNTNNRSTTWVASDISIGNEFDRNWSFELFAYLVNEEDRLDEGIVHEQRITAVQQARSSKVILLKTDQEEPLIASELSPSITITAIDRLYIAPASDSNRLVPINVGLEGLISGTFVKPEKSLIAISIQPVNSDLKWIMDDHLEPSGKRWSGTGFFGRYGMDEWVDFWVSGVITTRRFPKGQISPQVWEQYRHGFILAESEKVLVKRIEFPIDPKLEIKEVLISKVEEQHPKGEVPILVSQTSQIEGYIDGRPLKSTENLFVFSRSNSDECGQLLGKAYHQNGRRWALPLTNMGTPGESLKIVAVVVEGAITSLCDLNIRSKRILYTSKPVNILIKDVDDNLVAMTKIGNTQIVEDKAIPISGLVPIQGNYKFEEASDDYEIWVLGSDLNAENVAWRLIGKATKRANLSWSLPPIQLTDSAEAQLIAVVSKTEIKNLGPQYLSQVICFSKTIRVQQNLSEK